MVRRPWSKLAGRPETSRHEDVALAAYLLFLLCLAACGGASRPDAATQPIVRLAALILLAVVALTSDFHWRNACKPALLGLGAIALLILIQLVPLPPGLWAALPGHALYRPALAVYPEAWRPLNLTPDRGWNALFALLPPVAATIGAGAVRPDRQRWIAWMWLAIILASATLGLAQLSAGTDDAYRLYAAPPTGAAVGLFANRNHQALLLCCGLPLVAVAGGASPSRDPRFRAVLALAAGVFLLLMILATGSRAGILIAVVALPAAWLLAWPAARNREFTLVPMRRRQRLLLALVMVIGLLFVALTFSRAVAIERLFASDPADDARVRLIGPLLHMIATFFPFGSGFGSFDPVYRGFEPVEYLAPTYMNQAHDDVLQIGLEGGLPAILCLLVFLLWWGRCSVGLRSRTAVPGGALARSGSLLLLLMIIASFADYPLRTPLMMALAAPTETTLSSFRPAEKAP